MPNLILVRHGQTEWDKQKRLQGSVDIPLNNEGRMEAEELSKNLFSVDIRSVYSSTASCSVSTANEIAEPRKIKVKSMSEFNELDQGLWQGLLFKEIKKRYKKQYNIWKTQPTRAILPKGEPFRIACDRSISAIHKIMGNGAGDNVCIVAGDIILSIIKCYAKNIDFDKLWNVAPKKLCWEAVEFNQ